jgi:hypothetical protein
VFDPTLPGLPRLANQENTLRGAVVAQAERIHSVRQKAESENRMIYFKSIPRDMSDLPELPPRQFLSLHHSFVPLLLTLHSDLSLTPHGTI